MQFGLPSRHVPPRLGGLGSKTRAVRASVSAAPSAVVPHNSTFRAYSVTPLFDLQVTATAFGKYSSSLVDYLRAQENRVRGSSPYRVYHVVFSSPTRDGKEALSITVHYRRRFDEALLAASAKAGASSKGAGGALSELEEAKGKLTVILCACKDEADGVPMGGGAEQFTSLPLLLSKGPLSMARSVVQWLESTFDASVIPLQAPSYLLKRVLHRWLLQIVLTDPAHDSRKGPGRPSESGTISTGAKRPLELVFAVPDTVPGIDTITYTVDYDSIMSLYRAIRWQILSGRDEDDASAEPLSTAELDMLASLLYKGVLDQFESVFGISLDNVSLKQISSPLAMIADNRLKLLYPGQDNASFIVNSLREVLFPDTASAL